LEGHYLAVGLIPVFSFRSLLKRIGSEVETSGPIAFMEGRMADPGYFLD
jgi:hypothetical protein